LALGSVGELRWRSLCRLGRGERRVNQIEERRGRRLRRPSTRDSGKRRGDGSQGGQDGKIGGQRREAERRQHRFNGRGRRTQIDEILTPLLSLDLSIIECVRGSTCQQENTTQSTPFRPLTEAATEWIVPILHDRCTLLNDDKFVTFDMIHFCIQIKIAFTKILLGGQCIIRHQRIDMFIIPIPDLFSFALLSPCCQ